MAWAVRQTKTTASMAGGTSSSIALTFTSATLKNSLVKVWFTFGSSSNPVVSVLDDAGNSYVLAKFVGDGVNNQGVAVYYFVPPQAVNTVTVTFSASESFNGMVIEEWTGTGTGLPLDVSSSNNAASTTAANNVTSTATGTLAVANELVAGMVADDNGGQPTLSNGTGYSDAVTPPAGGGSSGDSEYLTASGTGAQTATWTSSAAGRYIAICCTFKPFVSPLPGLATYPKPLLRPRAAFKTKA